MAVPHHVTGHTGCELRVWGLKAAFAGLECETCHARWAVKDLQELADARVSKNIGTADTYCCTLPPTCTLGATSICSLLTACGIQTAPQPAEPKAVCRWCKGTGRVTLLTTSAPCDCVKQENTGTGWDALREAGGTVKQEGVGVGWKVKHVFNGLA